MIGMVDDEASDDFLKARAKALISIGREPQSGVLSPEEQQKAVRQMESAASEEQISRVNDKLNILIHRHDILIEAFNVTIKELRGQFARLERILKEQGELRLRQ